MHKLESIKLSSSLGFLYTFFGLKDLKCGMFSQGSSVLLVQ